MNERHADTLDLGDVSILKDTPKTRITIVGNVSRCSDSTYLTRPIQRETKGDRIIETLYLENGRVIIESEPGRLYAYTMNDNNRFKKFGECFYNIPRSISAEDALLEYRGKVIDRIISYEDVKTWKKIKGIPATKPYPAGKPIPKANTYHAPRLEDSFDMGSVRVAS